MFSAGMREMTLTHGCFISYRHTGGLSERFVTQLKPALEAYLREMDLPHGEHVWQDRYEIAPGEDFNITIAKAICSSVCMVTVFTPQYFTYDKVYCAREYQAMRAFEQKRRALLGDDAIGFIIPIRLMGDPPRMIAGEKNYVDMSRFKLHTKLDRAAFFSNEIFRIARQIEECYKRLRRVESTLGEDCRSFRLTDEEETKSWMVNEGLVAAPEPVLPFR